MLNYLPKRTQPKAKKILHDIWQAEAREDAHAAFDLFIETFEAKYPKATECLIKDRDDLLHMMFKLGQCAEKSWRKLRGFAHIADVIQGVDFVNSIKPSNQNQAAA